MLGNINRMYSMEIVIGTRSLVKIQSNLTTDTGRSKILWKPSPYRRPNARGIGFRLGDSFSSAASAASENA